MNEKDLLEKLKQSAEQISPPPSLDPEQIEKMLKEQDAGFDPKRAHQKPKRKISVYRLGGLAAVFVLAIVGSWQAGRLSVLKNGTPQGDITLLESGEQSAKADSGSINDSPVIDDTAANTESQQEIQSVEEEEVHDTSETQGSAAPSAQTTDTSEKSAASEEAAEPVVEVLKPAESYETLYQTLFDTFGNNNYSGDAICRAYGAESTMEYFAVEEDADVATAQDTGSVSSSDFSAQGQNNSYSQTNLQEAGVDEGDFVKTDGNYIYILKRSGSLVIVSAQEGTLQTVSNLKLPANDNVREMYVDGDLLSVIASEYYTEMDNSQENVISSKSGTRTKVYTYDISDRKNPVLSGTITQDGTFSQSRKNGDYIYLFTQFSPSILDTYEDSRIVPLTSAGEMAADDIYLPDNLNYPTYLVASSVNIRNPEKIADQKAVVSVASTFYASRENIYIANENWSDGTTRTELLQLHYANGKITGTAAGVVEGYLNNSFSLNEYNGYLRVVTTSYDENYNESNGLYILDKNLELVGAIRDLAPDETVRSARFFGDIGYFVTFRQTDPLFSVDLSDPANPKILGDLKISGFSTYLHFYNDTLLLGLGYEADENTGIRTGLKLSMFDISDPANVTEVSKLVINGITWCDSLEDYKSILIDPEKNIFGFTCDNRYMVFSYDEEKGFVKEFIYDFYNDMVNESLLSGQETDNNADSSLPADIGDDTSSSRQTETTAESDAMAAVDTAFSMGLYTDDSTTRGLYINNTLYLVRPNAVTAFDMTKEYKQTGLLFLK